MKPLLLIPHKSYSPEALSHAKLIAEKAGSPLHILYVGKRERNRTTGQEIVEKASETLDGTEVIGEVAIGDAIRELHKTAKEHNIDVVIIGEKKTNGFFGFLLDPVVSKVIAQSPVPVIEVCHPSEKMEKILICTGGTERANDAIEAGSKMANISGANATLLYVTGNVPSMYTGLDQMDETLAEILDTDTPLSRHLHHGAEVMEKYNLKGTLELRHGVASDTILTSAESGGYDLIVLGASRVGNNLRNWLLGNVSKQVIERTNIPVMVVHIGQSLS